MLFEEVPILNELFFTIKKIVFIAVVIAAVSDFALFAQSGNCHPVTPFFSVDLSADPNGGWTSPSVSRSNLCCSNISPDRCIEFDITLSPQTVAINFQIASGAVPSGAMYYQINCGTPIQVGSPICLNGPGPYTLTFCKPGNNPNSFAITSIAAPNGSPDKTVGDGCNTTMSVSGLVTSTISWTSISPGAVGAYNSYLNCTSACTTATVTPASAHPPYVDYKVCGTPSAGICAYPGQFCDTIRVYMSEPILNTITPNPASFCVNNPSVALTGTVNGGVAPYTYAWTNSANGGGTIVGNTISYTATATGTYSFIVYDQNYPACPASIVNVPVTSTPLPIVNAGLDKVSCGTSVNLSGTVTGASGGIWSGGAGGFMPGNTALNTSYTPTLSELNSGTVILTLSSTGNGACNAVSDQVSLFVSPPISAVIAGPSIICSGQTVSLTANVSGGTGPFTYLWNTGATTQTITTSAAGTYGVTVTGAAPGFCTATKTEVLTTNPPISISTTPNNAVACADSISISASATGGTGAYTYLWSTGATTSATSVNTGTYTITVTDAVGCSANSSVSVTASSSLAASVNQPSVVCNGVSATLTVTASGGLGGYTYLWANNSTTTSITEGAGNYCVTVTDGGGCIASACAAITENTPITVNIPVPATVCNGASATATATVSGGQAPYTFLWNSGQTTQSLTATAGTYSLTVTDFLNCSSSSTVTISQAAALSITPGTVAAGCFGGSNGSAAATVTGGTPSYSYAWSPFGGTAAAANGLTAGTYSVTVTDAMGCSQNTTMLVAQPAALTAAATVGNNVSCFGGSDGAATINPTGGTLPYSYLWSPGGAVTQTANSLLAGTYTVTVTDNNGCITSAQVTLTQPATAISASVDTLTNVACYNGSDAQVTIAATGGTPSYSFLWTPGGGTTATLSALTAGNYSVTVTDSKGCSFLLPVTITQPPSLTIAITAVTQVTCNGYNDGTATVSVGGGVAPYTYMWSTAPPQNTPTATGMGSGNYNAFITDANNCNAVSQTVTISEPTLLVATASPSTLISCDSAITISCSASGGSGLYTYLWSTGASTTSITVNTGSYIIVATDANNCPASDTVSVMATNSTLAVSITQPPNICNGGTILLTPAVTGGLGGNTYLWSNGATTASITEGAGNYCVTVTDAGGCIATGCVTVVENPVISIITPAPPLVCPGDSATVTVSATGGQTPYSYLWNTGETTSSITKPAGVYTLVLTDVTGSGCAASASVNITEETPVFTTVSHTDVSCYGAANGTVTVYASGGSSGYTYSWAPSGSTNTSVNHLGPALYTVTVTDSLGCIKTDTATVVQPLSPIIIAVSGTDNQCFGDSSGTAFATAGGGSAPYYFLWTVTGDTTNAINNLAAGTYIATVSDTSGCYVSDTIVIREPPELMITATALQFDCFGETGSVSLVASGGTAPYTISGSDTVNLVAGNYIYIVTDNKGCTDTSQAIINTGPAPFILTATATQIACSGGRGSVSLSVSGGDGTIVLTGDATTNLVAGAYNYTATDSTGCTAAAQAIIAPAPDSLTISITATQISCFGNSDGSAAAVVSGGTSPYQYLWQTGASGISVTGLASGTYSVGITDDRGCMIADSIIISEPFELLLSNDTVIASTCGLNNGSATVNVSGGTGMYSYAWLPYGGNSATADSLPAADYTVTVTDSNGCQQQTIFTVNSTSFLIADFGAAASCLNSSAMFSDSSTASPGSTITSWEWDYGDTSPADTVSNPSHTFAVSGIQNVTLTVNSSAGCSASVILPVIVQALPAADFTSTKVCAGASTVFADASTLQGDTISAWLWDFGDMTSASAFQNPTHTYSSSGDYTATLVVTSGNGCSDTATGIVTVYTNALVQFSVDDSSGCLIHCPFFTDLTAPSGTVITYWQWDYGDGSPYGNSANGEHCYTTTGAYTVSLTVTTAQGCTSTGIQNSLITVYPLPEAEFSFSPSSPASLIAADIDFSNQSTGSTAWNWDFGDSNDTTGSIIQHPGHIYTDAGTYCIRLIAMNNLQCADTVIHCLIIEPEFTFFIPNAFTPFDSPDTNDGFSGYGTNIKEYEMWIFDRWGNMIFHTTDLEMRWDGRANNGKEMAQRDVYVYLVKLVDFRGGNHQYRGTVTLVR